MNVSISVSLYTPPAITAITPSINGGTGSGGVTSSLASGAYQFFTVLAPHPFPGSSLSVNSSDSQFHVIGGPMQTAFTSILGNCPYPAFHFESSSTTLDSCNYANTTYFLGVINHGGATATTQISVSTQNIPPMMIPPLPYNHNVVVNTSSGLNLMFPVSPQGTRHECLIYV